MLCHGYILVGATRRDDRIVAIRLGFIQPLSAGSSRNLKKNFNCFADALTLMGQKLHLERNWKGNPTKYKSISFIESCLDFGMETTEFVHFLVNILQHDTI